MYTQIVKENLTILKYLKINTLVFSKEISFPPFRPNLYLYLNIYFIYINVIVLFIKYLSDLSILELILLNISSTSIWI